MAQVGVELVLEIIAGPAESGAERVAALDHESGDDAVKNNAIVKWPLNFLPRFRIRPFFLSGREVDEVGDGLRRLVVEEMDDDVAHARLDRRVKRPFFLLRLCEADSECKNKRREKCIYDHMTSGRSASRRRCCAR